MTPGIQPQQVRIKMIKMDPQPLSKTARGGNKMERITLNKLMVVVMFNIITMNLSQRVSANRRVE